MDHLKMPQTNLCRLCVCVYEESKSLYDDQGRPTDLYDITRNYFHPRILNLTQYRYLRKICLICWKKICYIQSFEADICVAQLELLEYEKFEKQLDEVKNETEQTPVEEGEDQPLETLAQELEDSPTINELRIAAVTSINVQSKEVTDHISHTSNPENDPCDLNHKSQLAKDVAIHVLDSSEDEEDRQKAKSVVSAIPLKTQTLDEASPSVSSIPTNQEFVKEPSLRKSLDSAVVTTNPYSANEPLEALSLYSESIEHTQQEDTIEETAPFVGDLDDFDLSLEQNEVDIDETSLIEQHQSSEQQYVGETNATDHYSKENDDRQDDNSNSSGELVNFPKKDKPDNDLKTLSSVSIQQQVVEHEDLLSASSPGDFSEENIPETSLHVSSSSSDESNQLPLQSIHNKRENLNTLISRWMPNIKCDLCPETFEMFTCLKRHFKEKHTEKLCCISCCGQKFRSNIKIRQHINKHLRPNWKCDLCGKCYITALNLKRHMLAKHVRFKSNPRPIPMGVSKANGNNANDKIRPRRTLTNRKNSRSQDGTDAKEINSASSNSDHPTTSMNQTVVQETASVDQTVVQETASQDHTVVQETASQDQTVVQETASQDQTVVQETTCKDQTVVQESDSSERLDKLIKKWKKKIACNVCQETFNKFSLLDIHFQQKHPTVVCYITCCARRHIGAARIEEHARKHLDPNNYRCDCCDFCFDNKSYLRRHFLKKHLKFKMQNTTKLKIQQQQQKRTKKILKLKRKKVKSKDLITMNNTSDNFNMDEFYALWKTTLICEMCPETFDKFSKLEEHFLQAHKENQFYVKCCNRTYHHDVVFEAHIREHLNPNAIKCELCNTVYLNRASLKRHQIIQHTAGDLDYSLKCQYCNKNFASQQAVRFHERTEHKDITMKKCHKCGKFFTPRALEMHNAYKHKKNTRKTELAAAAGSNVSSQKSDNILGDSSQFDDDHNKCEECGKICRSRKELLIHAKLFCTIKCNVCGKTFRSYPILNVHKRRQHPKVYKLENLNRMKQILKMSSRKSKSNTKTKASNKVTSNDGDGEGDVRLDQTSPPPAADDQPQNYSCLQCEKTFTSHKGLEIHKTVIHHSTNNNESSISELEKKKTSLEDKSSNSHQVNTISSSASNKFDEDLQQTSTPITSYDDASPRKIRKLSLEIERNSNLTPIEKLDKTTSPANIESSTPRLAKLKRRKSCIELTTKSNLTSRSDHTLNSHQVNTFDKGNLQEQTSPTAQDHVTNYICDICEKGFSSHKGLEIQKTVIHSRILNRTESTTRDRLQPTRPRKSSLEIVTPEKNVHPQTDSLTPNLVNEFPPSDKLHENQQDVEKIHTTSVHIKSPTQKCNKCGEMFKSAQSLYIHQLSMHVKPKADNMDGSASSSSTTSRFQCEHCDKNYTLKSNLKRHVMSSHPNMYDLKHPYNCSKCKKQFSKEEVLVKHLHLAHKDLPATIKCNKCGKNFTNKISLKMHKIRMHKRKYFVNATKIRKLKKPGKIASTLENAKNLSVTQKEDDTNNQDAGKTNHSSLFDDKDDTKHNECTGSNNRSSLSVYKCDICQKSYTKKSNLCAHQQKKHPSHNENNLEKENSIQEQSLQTPGDVAQEDSIPTSSTSANLQKQQQSPSTPISVECQKSFSTANSLIVHQETMHSTTTSAVVNSTALMFKCSTCHKEYSSKQNLNRHVNYAHNNKLNFKCKICDKSFRRFFQLQEHSTAHTGKDLYGCLFCSKTFKRYSTVYDHRKREHPQEKGMQYYKKLM